MRKIPELCNDQALLLSAWLIRWESLAPKFFGSLVNSRWRQLIELGKDTLPNTGIAVCAW